MAPEAESGLRERKKVRTRGAIQHHALRLFAVQGYEETTVSQIAEAAEVSESTFFRYFPTKEALVFEDDFDEALVAAIRAQPPGLAPIPAMRKAIQTTFADISPDEVADAKHRAELVFAVPELREAMAGRLLETIAEMSELMGARLGRPADDLAVRALVGALLGAMMAVFTSPGLLESTGWVELIDGALDQLEAGFPFPG